MDRRRGRTGEAPELKPLDVDGVRTVAIITVLWALAFVLLALRRTELDADDNGWWIWTCLAGVGLGLLGLEYCRKRRDAIARAELDAEADAGFDDAGDWADGELAALAAEDDSASAGFDQPTEAYAPDRHTPPSAPLQFEPPTPMPPSVPAPGSGRDDPDQHTMPYSAGGRPPPGYVTGDFPVVPPEPAQRPAARDPYPTTETGGEAVRPARRRRPAPPPPPSAPAEPLYSSSAAPAGYSPDPDQSRRHPRDEELARRYREEQERAAAGGYDPPSYPEFLQDEAARQDVPPEEPRAQEPPRSPRPRAGFESEFFTDEPATDTSRGADFLLDDDEPDGGYRGRRARRD